MVRTLILTFIRDCSAIVNIIRSKGRWDGQEVRDTGKALTLSFFLNKNEDF